jgi:AraC family transcriptional regulator
MPSDSDLNYANQPPRTPQELSGAGNRPMLSYRLTLLEVPLNVVERALWHVEAHTRSQLTLESIASACAVSPFYLTRAFALTTGLSLMRYVRARRLTDAAHKLAAGANDIFDLALDAGYGSHEAFTRAFREHFGTTPESVRARRHLNTLHLQEPANMCATTNVELAIPRIETMKPRTFGGLVERYDCNDPGKIPGLWQRFSSFIGRVPGQVPFVAYGVCYNFDKDNDYDYMCGVELTSMNDLPSGFKTVSLPAQRYAVFADKAHISGVRNVIGAIWSSWLPTSGYNAMEGAMLERYGPEFDARTGMGGYEIWVPIE